MVVTPAIASCQLTTIQKETSLEHVALTSDGCGQQKIALELRDNSTA
jgi:hypothetical protein